MFFLKIMNYPIFFLSLSTWNDLDSEFNSIELAKLIAGTIGQNCKFS